MSDKNKKALHDTVSEVFWILLVCLVIGLLNREVMMCIGVIAAVLFFVALCYKVWCGIFRR